MKRTAFEVSIEHIAREAAEGPDGGLVATGRPEATAMFVSFAREIPEAVLEGVEAQGVDRVILLPAEGPLGNYPPTDGGDWFDAGVPVVNCISNPVYLLTDRRRPPLGRPRAAPEDGLGLRADHPPARRRRPPPLGLDRVVALPAGDEGAPPGGPRRDDPARAPGGSTEPRRGGEFKHVTAELA